MALTLPHPAALLTMQILFFFPQLLDLCVLDIGSLQFSYSILAASALYHMLPVNVEQVTGEENSVAAYIIE